MTDNESLPELVYEDLRPGKAFPPMRFAVTKVLVDAYLDALGCGGPLYHEQGSHDAGHRQLAPPGLAGIWGRQSYLQHNRMPHGGILAEQGIVLRAPMYVGDVLTVQATVAARQERKGRRFVTIETQARDEGGRLCAVVKMTAIWPK